MEIFLAIMPNCNGNATLQKTLFWKVKDPLLWYYSSVLLQFILKLKSRMEWLQGLNSFIDLTMIITMCRSPLSAPIRACVWVCVCMTVMRERINSLDTKFCLKDFIISVIVYVCRQHIILSSVKNRMSLELCSFVVQKIVRDQKETQTELESAPGCFLLGRMSWVGSKSISIQPLRKLNDTSDIALQNGCVQSWWKVCVWAVNGEREERYKLLKLSC